MTYAGEVEHRVYAAADLYVTDKEVDLGPQMRLIKQLVRQVVERMEPAPPPTPAILQRFEVTNTTADHFRAKERFTLERVGIMQPFKPSPVGGQMPPPSSPWRYQLSYKFTQFQRPDVTAVGLLRPQEATQLVGRAIPAANLKNVQGFQAAHSPLAGIEEFSLMDAGGGTWSPTTS